jgi:hypothetical protein
MVTAQRRALVAVLSFGGALRCAIAEAGGERASVARADFVPGFSLGARLGLGFPFGDRAKVAGVPESMGPSANYASMLPIWIDAGYRFTKVVYRRVRTEASSSRTSRSESTFIPALASNGGPSYRFRSTNTRRKPRRCPQVRKLFPDPWNAGSM